MKRTEILGGREEKERTAGGNKETSIKIKKNGLGKGESTGESWVEKRKS